MVSGTHLALLVVVVVDHARHHVLLAPAVCGEGLSVQGLGTQV